MNPLIPNNKTMPSTWVEVAKNRKRSIMEMKKKLMLVVSNMANARERTSDVTKTIELKSNKMMMPRKLVMKTKNVITIPFALSIESGETFNS